MSTTFAEALFWRRVDKTGTCWLWCGTKNQKGYGVASVAGHHTMAHRVAWRLTGRALDPALTLDHLCRNRACVNPDHLEQVTQRENVLRGDTLPAANLRKTHCPKGHPLSGPNLVNRRNGDRRCRTCRSVQNREWRARNAPRPSRAEYKRRWRAARALPRAEPEGVAHE